MAIMTFTVDQVAGMIARMDRERGQGHVLIVAASSTEASQLEAQVAEALGARVVKRIKVKGRLKLALSGGVTVLTLYPQGIRSHSATMIAFTAAAGQQFTEGEITSRRATGCATVQVHTATPVHAGDRDADAAAAAAAADVEDGEYGEQAEDNTPVR